MFGHNSQMPQIFAGFGITTAFLFRGVNGAMRRLFRWRGADGAECVAHRFGPYGYGDFAVVVRGGPEYAVTLDGAHIRERLAAYMKREADATPAGPVLLFDGCDHQDWDEAVYREVVKASFAGAPVKHERLDVYAAALSASASRIRPMETGELRDPGRTAHDPAHPHDGDHQHLIPGVLSSRFRLKRAMLACETLLLRWAEPLDALAAGAGGEDHADHLALAWKYFHRNMAHDSIDGCSIDQVHRDMAYRFDQCRLLAEDSARDSAATLTAAVAGCIGGKERRFGLFNALPRDREDVVTATVRVPTDWPTFGEFFGYEPLATFRLFDSSGREVPYQRIGQRMNRLRMRMCDLKFAENIQEHEVDIAFRARLPALGYAVFTIRATEKPEPVRPPMAARLAMDHRTLDNGVLTVTAEADGTLTLVDKRTGQRYERLLAPEDCADLGDGWNHGPAANDEIRLGPGVVDTALAADGPLLSTLRILTRMRVPGAFDFTAGKRGGETVDLVVTHEVTLRAGAGHVDLRTTVDNRADDHRLWFLFPSGARGAKTCLADSAFDVMERPIALRADNHLYRELEVETKPQHSWTAVFNPKRGLAVVAPGQLETSVRDLPARPIALTMFRGTRRTVGTTGEPDGQERSVLSCDYAVAPFAGAPDRVALSELGQRVAAPPRAVTLAEADRVLFAARRSGAGANVELPMRGGLLGLEGPVLCSSVRRVDGGLEARLFNPWPRKVNAVLRPGAGGRGVNWKQAARVELDGRPRERLGTGGGKEIRLSLRAKEIATVRIGGDSAGTQAAPSRRRLSP